MVYCTFRIGSTPAMRRLRVRFPLGAQNFLSLEACCACAFIYYISLLASYHILPYTQIITLIKT